MPLGSFKDLCIDANDAERVGRFWAAALGLELHRRDSGNTCLTGASSEQTIWVNQVSERKQVKHRIHLDINGRVGSTRGELEARGAMVVDADSFAWIAMTDPEGGEFCLFERDQPFAYGLYEIVVDCVDHQAISQWWADAIGGTQIADRRGFSFIEQIPGAPFENMSFLPVDEPKVGKNRIHLDLVGSADDFVAAGATRLRGPDLEISWSVLADPEGNEFCVFAP